VHAIAKAIGRDSRAVAALTTGFSGCPDQVLSRNALRHVTVTALLCVWSSANEHSVDGLLSCCDLEDLDEISGVPGFGDAMHSVGWAIPDQAGKCVSLPNFREHNTPAKDRTGAERQRRYRKKRNGDVTPLRNAVTVTQRREEKRREEEIHTHTHGDDDFRQPGWAADEWQRFAAAWNVTERAEPWPHLTPPDGWVDLAASPGWLERAREALARLPSRQFFDRPLPVTRFFDFVDRIRAGEFADPKGSTRSRPRQLAGGNL
jgi:hypothetical protein